MKREATALGEVVTDGKDSCGGAIFRADFGIDAREMVLDSLLAQDELVRDLAIAAPGGHEAEDLDFTGTEASGQRLAPRRTFACLAVQRLIHVTDFGIVAKLGA